MVSTNMLANSLERYWGRASYDRSNGLFSKYIKYSPRSKGFPSNWDLDIWKFGISVCMWRVPVVFISWSRDWIVNSDDPHNQKKWAVRSESNMKQNWFLFGIEMGGRWSIHIGMRSE